MKTRLALAAITIGCAIAGYNPPAHAVGCISGGLAGAVAGHMVHHGVLGAIGGCVAGHQYHKHQQRDMMQQRSGDYGNGNSYRDQNASRDYQ